MNVIYYGINRYNDFDPLLKERNSIPWISGKTKTIFYLFHKKYQKHHSVLKYFV